MDAFAVVVALIVLMAGYHWVQLTRQVNQLVRAYSELVTALRPEPIDNPLEYSDKAPRDQ